MALIFVFVDGVGVGSESTTNPFWQETFPFFEEAAGGCQMTISAADRLETNHVFLRLDANLKVDGLPQSGTGQVSLFTGQNAARLIGQHFGPYPHSGTRDMLKENSLARKVVDSGKKFCFMNAYPPIFFELSEKRNRWSTSTLMCRQAGVPLHTVDDVYAERAITAEITQEAWAERLGIPIPRTTPERAAQILVNATSSYDVVMYEYYLTDKAGHAMDGVMARLVISRLDRFLGAIKNGMNRNDVLVLCSDHGNVEDLSVKTHTRNPVPLIAMGDKAEAFAEVKSITDVTPAILATL